MKKKTQDDLRFRKTERLIQQTFRELLKEKDYFHISIQELASRAEINRNTFYLHYPSKDISLLIHQIPIIMHLSNLTKNTSIMMPTLIRYCWHILMAA